MRNAGRVISLSRCNLPVFVTMIVFLWLLHLANERICCRCGKRFTVYADGSYARNEQCVYHWGKAWKKRGQLIQYFCLTSLHTQPHGLSSGLLIYVSSCPEHAPFFCLIFRKTIGFYCCTLFISSTWTQSQSLITVCRAGALMPNKLDQLNLAASRPCCNDDNSLTTAPFHH